MILITVIYVITIRDNYHHSTLQTTIPNPQPNSHKVRDEVVIDSLSSGQSKSGIKRNRCVILRKIKPFKVNIRHLIIV